MPSNNKPFNQNRLGKAIKATLPLFAFMGGGAVASTRNQSSSFSGRRLKSPAIVYVTKADEAYGDNSLIKNRAQHTNAKSGRSAFGAFTNKYSKKVTPVEIDVDSEALAFLKANDLLSSGESIQARLSGNTLGRKTFVDFCHSVNVGAATSLPDSLIPGAGTITAQANVISGFTNKAACTTAGNIWHYTTGGVCTSVAQGTPAACMAGSFYWRGFNVNGIAGSNVAPTLTGTPASISVTEDVASDVNLSAVTFADADGDSLTVTLTANAGTLAATSGGSVTVGGTGTGTMTLDGTAANINTFLDTTTNIKYTTVSNDTTARNIAVKVNDGTVDSATSNITVNITAVNDDPTETGTFPTDITVSEDIAGNFDLSGLTLADADAGASSVVLTSTASAGTLAATSGGGVTVGGSGTGTLTLTGTVSNIDTFLNTASNIQYTGASNVNGNDAATVAVKINDGGNTGTGGGGDVALGTVNMDITSSNDGPTIAGAPASVTVTEDVASDVNLSAVTFADADGDSLTVTLTANAGTLTATSGGSVTVGGTGTGTMTLDGTAANINTFLDTTTNIKYTTVSNDTTARNIAVKVNDGTVDSATSNITVNITAVNDDPTETGTFPTDITVSEDIAGNFDLSGLTLADADAGASSVVLTSTASAGTLAATSGGGVTVGGSGTGTLTLTGTVSNIDTFLNTASNIQYTGASNVNGNDAATVVVKINDGGNIGTGGGGDVALGTVNMDITAINDLPTDIGLSSTSINRNATGAAANVGNLSTTDADDVSFTYTLVSAGTAANGSCGVGNDADNASFQITGASFETSGALVAGSYDVCVQTNDGSTTFEKTFAITVVDSVAPTINAVTIPNSAHKVGDVVTATITVTSDTDDYTTGSGGISGTINGYTLGSFSRTNDTTYTATFTVIDGGTDVAAGSDVAVNFTLTDSTGNTSGAFTTAISQTSDAIYANLPDVNLTASTTTLAEDGGTSTLTGTLSGSLNNQWPVDVTVNLAYTGTGTITTDYTGAAAITITSGGSTGTTVVTSLADTLFDAPIAETIIVDINSLSVGNEGTTNQQTLSITDAESAPVTTLSVGNASVAENSGTSSISATLDNATYADVTVNLAYSGTATLGGTDANTPSASITIPAGSTTANAVTGVTSISDALVEGNETIIMDIASVAGGSATENGTQQQTVTITDDDVPNISLSVSASPIAEAAGNSTVTATLSQVTFANVTVTLGYTGTATDVTDYTKTNTITIPTGNLTGSTTLTAVQDTVPEQGETVIIDVTGVSGGLAVENGVQQQTVTITDDEVVNVSLSASPTSFNEVGGVSTVTATLDQATYADVTVNLGYTGTATTVTDYTTAGDITITAGQTTGTTVLTGVGDASVEGAESIIVDITGVAGGSAVENGVQQQTLTLTDTNNAPVISSTAVTTVNEGSLYSYTFTVTDVDVGDTLTLSATQLPGWLSFNPATGVLSGTPTNDEVGTHNVTLRVNDGTENVDQAFVITVTNINDAPLISSCTYYSD